MTRDFWRITIPDKNKLRRPFVSEFVQHSNFACYCVRYVFLCHLCCFWSISWCEQHYSCVVFSNTANTQVVEKGLTSLPHKAIRVAKLKKGEIQCKGKHIYTKVKWGMISEFSFGLRPLFQTNTYVVSYLFSPVKASHKSNPSSVP